MRISVICGLPATLGKNRPEVPGGGRNRYNPRTLARLGFTYICIGRAGATVMR